MYENVQQLMAEHAGLVGFSQRGLSSSSAPAQADLNDDFKSKFADSRVDVTKQIESDINGSKVFVYMKVSVASCAWPAGIAQHTQR